MDDEVKTGAEVGAEATGDQAAAATATATADATAKSPEKGKPAKTEQTEPVDWEKKFKGLQAAYQTLDGAKKDTDAKAVELGQKVEELTTKLLAESAKLEQWNETMTKQEETVAELQAKLDRKNLILEEFPALAPFEAKGVLPDAEDADGLRAKFTDFASLIAGQTSESVAKALAGATPDGQLKTGKVQEPQSIADLTDAYMKANKAGDWKESDRLHALLVAQQSKLFQAGVAQETKP